MWCKANSGQDCLVLTKVLYFVTFNQLQLWRWQKATGTQGASHLSQFGKAIHCQKCRCGFSTFMPVSQTLIETTKQIRSCPFISSQVQHTSVILTTPKLHLKLGSWKWKGRGDMVHTDLEDELGKKRILHTSFCQSGLLVPGLSLLPGIYVDINTCRFTACSAQWVHILK